MFGHIFGLFYSPVKEWGIIRQKLENGTCNFVALVFILAIVPPVCGYIGTTQIGWKIGTSAPVKLAQSSALMISIAYYFAIVFGIFVMGYIIKWMGQTYVKSVTLQDRLR